MRRPWLLLLVLLGAIGVVAFVLQRPRSKDDVRAVAPPTGRNVLALHVGPEDGYAGSDACLECHQEQHESWHRTYHRTMTQTASPENILARHEDTTLKAHGRTYQLTWEADGFWIDMPDPEWEDAQQRAGRDLSRIENPPRVRRRIVMTTGSHHYQGYWIHGNAGYDLLQVPFVYLLGEQRWVRRQDVFLHPPDDERVFAIWNANCIQCHSVAGEVRHDLETDSFKSRVIELGIACESCHGPAAQHVAFRRSTETEGIADPIVNPATLSHELSSQVCGQCHAYFYPNDSYHWWDYGYRRSFRPGEPLEDSRSLVRLDSASDDPKVQALIDRTSQGGLYWPDGSVRVGGREYLGISASPCFERGEMSCLSCHSMHQYREAADQLGVEMHTNQACLQCHVEYRDDVSGHTHHPAASSGSLCYNCHMPYTSLALLKAIRSHRITSPSVTRTLEQQTPNACNLCHLDQTLEWTADYLHEWHGQARPELPQLDRRVAHSAQLLLRGDAAERAAAVWSTEWRAGRDAAGADWMPPYLAQLLVDPYHVVRFMAYRSLRSLPGYDDLAYDFAAPAQERARVRDAVLARWRTRDAVRHDRRALLIGDDGELDTGAFERLLRQRDDRPVYISE